MGRLGRVERGVGYVDEVEWKLHEFDEGQTNYRVFSARLHCIVANGADTISFFTARNRMGHIKLL